MGLPRRHDPAAPLLAQEYCLRPDLIPATGRRVAFCLWIRRHPPALARRPSRLRHVLDPRHGAGRRALGKADPAPWAQFLAAQLDHVEWQGFHFLDLIFPLFVFIAGVSLTFSLSRSLAQRGRAATIRKVCLRAFVLYLLGVVYYGGLGEGIDHIRWLGVLQRIAICGLCAGLLFCWAGERRSAAVAASGAAVLYLAEKYVRFKAIATALAGGPFAAWCGAYGEVVIALVAVGLSVLLAWFLYSRRIFLRV
jgi:Heparan-alpha-glucosaminide N-acetyltransferase, catalytic